MRNGFWLSLSLMTAVGLIGIGCAAEPADDGSDTKPPEDESVQVEVTEGNTEPRLWFGWGTDACLMGCSTQACTDNCIKQFCPKGTCY